MIDRLRTLGALGLAIGALASSPALAADKAAEAQHMTTAFMTAGDDLHNGILGICHAAAASEALNVLMRVSPPTKAIGDLYVLSEGSVSAWALKTSGGIILFDTLNNEQDVKTIIEPGLQKLGLNPADIKYVVITHGHGDHSGGARYLQTKYPNLKVVMSEADYGLTEAGAARVVPGRPSAPAPRRDIVATDGQKLTLGDTTVTLYITPGHTPGTISAIIPVRDAAGPHNLALWGGTTPSASNRAAVEQYLASLERFTQIKRAANVEGMLSNHPNWDNTLQKLAKNAKTPNGPNAFLEGPAVMDRWNTVLRECSLAIIARMP